MLQEPEDEEGGELEEGEGQMPEASEDRMLDADGNRIDGLSDAEDEKMQQDEGFEDAFRMASAAASAAPAPKPLVRTPAAGAIRGQKRKDELPDPNPSAKVSKTAGAAGAAPTAAQQVVLDKANEALSKIKTSFGADKIWEGIVRRRQVDGFIKSTSALSAKLGGLPSDKVPEALDISQKLMEEVNTLDARYDAITSVRQSPRASVEQMEKPDHDALLTCDMAVLNSMLTKTAADLLKQLDSQVGLRLVTPNSHSLISLPRSFHTSMEFIES